MYLIPDTTQAQLKKTIISSIIFYDEKKAISIGSASISGTEAYVCQGVHQGAPAVP